MSCRISVVISAERTILLVSWWWLVDPHPPATNERKSVSTINALTDSWCHFPPRTPPPRARGMGAGTSKEAAARAGVSERTAYRRMADPRFREQLSASRQAVIAGIVGKLSANADGVLGVLFELIHDGKAPATARVRACHDWLDALETSGRGPFRKARGARPVLKTAAFRDPSRSQLPLCFASRPLLQKKRCAARAHRRPRKRLREGAGDRTAT